MKKKKTFLCVSAFALICIATVSFLSLFTETYSPILGYVSWISAELIDENGSISFDPYTAVPPETWQPGQDIRITGRLPELSELPELYGGNGYTMLEYSGMDLTVEIDGAERLHLFSSNQNSDTHYYEVLHIVLSPEDAGKEFVILYTPYSEEAFWAPLLARFSSEDAVYRADYSFAVQNALPAGAYALSFVFICMIFLLSFYMDTPAWALLLLALVVFFSCVIDLNKLLGFNLFPHKLYFFLATERSYFLLVGLVLLYFLSMRKRSYWRYLARVTFYTTLVLAVWYGISSLHNGSLAFSVNLLLANLFEGQLHLAFYYLSIYLTTASAGITAYSLLRSHLHIRTEASTLTMHNHLILENYRQMEQNLRSTSLMRHEWKNQVAALHLLAVQKNYEELDRKLEQMDSSLNHISTRHYSDNITVNVILQNMEMKAADLGVRFHAAAPLPESLNIDISDLCSLLINMLDNALDAASKADGNREIRISLKMSFSFLAIKCENTYTGPLSIDQDGHFRSTKSDSEHYGIGITQMQNVAAKYNGILSIEYTENWFTVQTALSITV